MTKSRDPTPRPGKATGGEPDDDAPLGDGFDGPETESTDELEEETGIDLTDASDLDADHIPADEESDRIRQAPD